VLAEVPAHWLTGEELETRLPASVVSLYKFGNLVVLDDLDLPEESPGFPAAAGMELLVIIFGGAYVDEKTARDANEHQISPWCLDLSVDTVDTDQWLFPTELDEDAVPQTHRTGSESAAKELNLINSERIRQKGIATKARHLAEEGGVRAKELALGSDALPDVDDFMQSDTKLFAVSKVEVTRPGEAGAEPTWETVDVEPTDYDRNWGVGEPGQDSGDADMGVLPEL